MGNVSPIVAKPKSVDDRAALCAAIEAAAAARAKLEAHRRACHRGLELIDTAEAKLEAAGIAVTRAREEHIEQLADALVGDANLPTSVTRAARLAEQDAQDELTAAKSAYRQLDTSTVEVERVIRDADANVQLEIAELCASLMPEALAKAKAAEVALAEHKAILDALQSFDLAYAAWRKRGQFEERHGAMRKEVLMFLHPGKQVDKAVTERWRSTMDNWQTVKAQLRLDPNAQLPELPT